MLDIRKSLIYFESKFLVTRPHKKYFEKYNPDLVIVSSLSGIVYNENLPNVVNKANYSARKDPDNYHYEMVRCLSCKLLYANSIYLSNIINQIRNIFFV